MRFKIVSRIFEPEPSAASFRLGALASELATAGHSVAVLTVRPPSKLAELSADDERTYRVRRFPVLRDRSGYVRGYLPYLSFDLPLFFRILLGSRVDVIVVEPPPTTGFFVRIAASLRRSAYVYYAADVWSEATKLTGASGFVIRVVATVERWVLNGARLVLATSPEVERRLAEIGVRAPVVTVGNGVDVSAFVFEDQPQEQQAPLFIYGGTAAEWHGAEVFVRAMETVQRQYPAARLRFIGGGSQKDRLEALARRLKLRDTEFLDPLPPEQLGDWLVSATASLASVRPGTAYEFAFPTKLYGSTAAGAPLIFSGAGPAVDYVRTEVAGQPLGQACGFSVDEVAAAMIRAIETPPTAEQRKRVSQWGQSNVDLAIVVERIRHQIERVMRV
jgi:glycosyltransferase involved in cell wall biosynthesis